MDLEAIKAFNLTLVLLHMLPLDFKTYFGINFDCLVLCDYCLALVPFNYCFQ